MLNPKLTHSLKKHSRKFASCYPICLPHFSQYTAYILLFEPQKMQNLISSEGASSFCRAIVSGVGYVSLFWDSVCFFTDHTTRITEATMANRIITKNPGLSAIKLNDKGRTG